MTEAEWLASDNPAAMLAAIVDRTLSGRPRLTDRVSDRKLRLWVEACRAACGPNRPWRDLDDVSSMRVMLEFWSGNVPTPKSDRAALLREIVGNPVRPVTLPYFGARGSVNYRPGDPVKLDDDARCDWLTPTVLSLAQAAYDERATEILSGDAGRSSITGRLIEITLEVDAGTLDPFRLALLADALEEAGCDNAAILAHLRSPGPHVRGCWALDLTLGNS